MDLSITYLGLKLKHPLMPGASPLTHELGTTRALEDAGASAIVMHSLFEEQIKGGRFASLYRREMLPDGGAETASYFPRQHEFATGPTEYLEKIRTAKQAVEVPVIASLNGVSEEGWLQYAKLIEKAGADALELNVNEINADPRESSADIEKRVVDVVREVRKAVQIPIAVKLSPFYSSLPNLAWQIELAGANGLVLFNRYYQPDLDVSSREIRPRYHLSEPSELLIRLRWLGILSGTVGASLACSGGVYSGGDAVKAVLAGAHAVQVVSALLRSGPKYLGLILDEMMQWMKTHEYHTARRMRGDMGLGRYVDPSAVERANYIRAITGWNDPIGWEVADDQGSGAD